MKDYRISPHAPSSDYSSSSSSSSGSTSWCDEETTTASDPPDTSTRTFPVMGCCYCFQRDRWDGHVSHCFLYTLVLTYGGFMLWTFVLHPHSSFSTCVDAMYYNCSTWIPNPVLIVAGIVLYGAFLAECFDSKLFHGLKQLQSQRSTLDYLENLYSAKPIVTMTIRCFHYETQTHHSGDAVHVHKVRIETLEREKVVRLEDWEDISDRLHSSDFPSVVTQIELETYFFGDDTFQRRLEDFIWRYRDCDDHYETEVELDLEGGFQPYFIMSYTRKPLLVTHVYYVVAHLLVLPSLPYRIWISSMTGKIEASIRKKVWTR